ncbi:hypothetical protein PR048_008305 [Dryococelus australis]|uniref:Uncharacterized protein n=1 Tax=Dryococelus australis TaxID=614101 RepID=A0ABQ9HWQ8_9NEOP|nr:hypothetical protein PR048_008305 [Dryococelus australis]
MPKLPKCWFWPGFHFNQVCPGTNPTVTKNEARASETIGPGAQWTTTSCSIRSTPSIDTLTEGDETPKALHIEVTIDEKTAIALLDSAATGNFVHILTRGEKGVRSPRNQLLKIKDTINLRFKVGNHDPQAKFLVIPYIGEELILEQPWLQCQQCIIDCEQKRIYINNQECDTRRNYTTRSIQQEIWLTQDHPIYCHLYWAARDYYGVGPNYEETRQCGTLKLPGTIAVQSNSIWLKECLGILPETDVSGGSSRLDWRILLCILA